MMNPPNNNNNVNNHVNQQAAELMMNGPAAAMGYGSVMDPSMMLTDQERQWACDLKTALGESSRFENLQLSDMVIAQHALAAQGNIVEAMVRIEGLQQFAEEYQIDHSLEQAMWVIENFLKQQPGYILHFDVDIGNTQQAVMVSDSAAFSQKAAFESSKNKTADENWKICVSGIYYLHYILQPTIASMRQGLSATVECDGVGWHNFSMEYITRLFEEMFSYLPVQFQCIQAYNTTVVANLLFSLARPFMGQNMKQSVQLGFQIQTEPDTNTVRRLSEFYLQPSLPAQQLRLYQRIQTLMMVRIINDKQFRL